MSDPCDTTLQYSVLLQYISNKTEKNTWVIAQVLVSFSSFVTSLPDNVKSTLSLLNKDFLSLFVNGGDSLLKWPHCVQTTAYLSCQFSIGYVINLQLIADAARYVTLSYALFVWVRWVVCDPCAVATACLHREALRHGCHRRSFNQPSRNVL